jgi:MGT family glycosyltransferase
MSTVLVHTSPAAGHAFPVVPGLLELQRRGHVVHLRTQSTLVDVIRAAGLEHVEALDPRIEAIEATDYAVRSPKARLTRGLEDLISRGPHEREGLLADVEAIDPDALLVDFNAYGASVTASTLGRPWAYVWPTLLAYPQDDVPPFGFGLKPRGGALGRARNRRKNPAQIKMYSGAMLPGLNGLRAEAGLPPLRDVLDHIRAADRMLLMSGQPIEYPRTGLPEQLRWVGPQVWEPEADEPAWLQEEGDPWVLVTCSTEYQGDERLAAAAIEALRDEPVRVVVTLADAFGADLPEAPNARVERFVPHGHVLRRAAAVVCHGGMGIVQKSVLAGVPSVVVPFGRDQPEVARRVTECGAGVALSPRRLTPERLRHAVRAAIARTPGAKAAGARLAASGGPERFADEAEALVGEPALVAA